MNQQPEFVAEFIDKYGDTQKIHKTRHGLKVFRNETTVILGLNRVISKMTGTNIKTRRVAQGISLAKLCAKAGIPTGTPKNRMWEIENALRSQGVRLGTIYAVAIALGIEAKELLPTNAEVMEAASVRIESRPSGIIKMIEKS